MPFLSEGNKFLVSHRHENYFALFLYSNLRKRKQESDVCRFSFVVNENLNLSYVFPHVIEEPNPHLL